MRYRTAFIVEDLELVARDRLAARARAQIVESVRAVDMKHLGPRDAVQDGQPVHVLPPTPDLRGQRFGGGDAVAYRRQVAAASAFEVEDRVVERRGREEEGG